MKLVLLVFFIIGSMSTSHGIGLDKSSCEYNPSRVHLKNVHTVEVDNQKNAYLVQGWSPKSGQKCSAFPINPQTRECFELGKKALDSYFNAKLFKAKNGFEFYTETEYKVVDGVLQSGSPFEDLILTTCVLQKPTTIF